MTVPAERVAVLPQEVEVKVVVVAAVSATTLEEGAVAVDRQLTPKPTKIFSQIFNKNS